MTNCFVFSFGRRNYSVGSWLSLPFLSSWKLYLRWMHSISWFLCLVSRFCKYYKQLLRFFTEFQQFDVVLTLWLRSKFERAWLCIKPSCQSTKCTSNYRIWAVRRRRRRYRKYSIETTRSRNSNSTTHQSRLWCKIPSSRWLSSWFVLFDGLVLLNEGLLVLSKTFIIVWFLGWQRKVVATRRFACRSNETNYKKFPSWIWFVHRQKSHAICWST